MRPWAQSMFWPPVSYWLDRCKYDVTSGSVCRADDSSSEGHGFSLCPGHLLHIGWVSVM